MNVCAGIVLFNPNMRRLSECVNAVANQVNKIILIDNGSSNYLEIERWVNKCGLDICLIQNASNKGIAVGLNQILKYSLDIKADWFLSLDQDSVVSNNLIKWYSDYPGENVAQICCNIVDRNIGNIDKFGTGGGKWKDVDCCLTSGTLNRTEIINKVGGFREELFIDGVDMDISYTLLECGYTILKSNHYGLLHELGEGKIKRIFGKTYSISNHSPWRNYYARRNHIWIAKLHFSGWKKYKAIILQFIYGVGAIILEDNKIERLKFNAQGLFDGVTQKSR